ncbi:RNA recognition motif domain-containing protein [Dioscorea alata]|uniref:RNA recognition motif domain-containing protein n=1 Tax=Dioscorea alata TaxID=55571 RepID=A0ACB7W3I0_DIOAL|nr:RNA recognition motif domain-containing protein [Dioscorea alata]
MEKIGVGVTKVDLVMRKYGGCNKGFAFVEYRNHDCAKYSKEKMSDPRFKLDRNDDDPSSSQVKSIYVKNLPNNVTEDQLRRLFEHHGKITEVQLPTPKFEQEDRYGFVHFSERSGARKALRNSERYHVDGRVLECDLGKAQTVKKVATGPNTQKGPLPPNCPSQMDNMCRSRKCQNCQLILIAVVCLLLFIILVIACSGNGRFSKDEQINGKIQKLKFNLH